MALSFGFIKQLFTPVAYLRIKHPVKRHFDWTLPLFLTGFSALLFFSLPSLPAVSGPEGLVFVVTDLIKILVGFYIASLAAVSTFDRPSMDEMIAGEEPTLSVSRKGIEKTIKLTRRRFLCYLFGYLSFLGMALYFLGATSNLLANPLHETLCPKYYEAAKYSFLALYFFFVFNLLTTTLLGLHFLTDRIHRPS